MLRKIILSAFITCFATQTFAIQVNVSSPSSVSALGFTVDGKKYGGMGKSYNKSGVPTGMYRFGVRVNGIFGNDIACFNQGKISVFLTKDSDVTLIYNNNRCTAKVN